MKRLLVKIRLKSPLLFGVVCLTACGQSQTLQPVPRARVEPIVLLAVERTFERCWWFEKYHAEAPPETPSLEGLTFEVRAPDPLRLLEGGVAAWYKDPDTPPVDDPANLAPLNWRDDGDDQVIETPFNGFWSFSVRIRVSDGPQARAWMDSTSDVAPFETHLELVAHVFPCEDAEWYPPNRGPGRQDAAGLR